MNKAWSNRITCLALKLQDYKYDVRIIKDKGIIIADMLSHCLSDLEPEEHIIGQTAHFKPKMDLNYQEDLESNIILKRLQNSQEPYVNVMGRNYRYSQELILTKYRYEKKWRIMIPFHSKLDFIKQYHDNSEHFGIK